MAPCADSRVLSGIRQISERLNISVHATMRVPVTAQAFAESVTWPGFHFYSCFTRSLLQSALP